MAMASEVHSQISKRNAIAIGGNLEVSGNSGGSAATFVLRHQISSVSSIEVVASAGLHALVGVQITRYDNYLQVGLISQLSSHDLLYSNFFVTFFSNLSLHSTATMGTAMSLRDGTINLSNAWTRQLSETSNGNVCLFWD